jgi:hypothetical protein
MVSSVSTTNVVRSAIRGKRCELFRFGGRTCTEDSPWPTAGSPNRRAASTLLSAANPAIAAARAADTPQPVGAASPEVDERGSPAGTEATTRRLGGDGGLVGDLVEHDRLDELRHGYGAVTSIKGASANSPHEAGRHRQLVEVGDEAKTHGPSPFPADEDSDASPHDRCAVQFVKATQPLTRSASRHPRAQRASGRGRDRRIAMEEDRFGSDRLGDIGKVGGKPDEQIVDGDHADELLAADHGDPPDGVGAE